MAAKFKINTVLEDPEFRGLKSFSEGDDVPDWAFEQLGDHAFEGTRPGVEEDPEGEGRPYSQWKKDELLAEVARRNESRDDEDQLDDSGTKAELAERLTEDDADDE